MPGRGCDYIENWNMRRDELAESNYGSILKLALASAVQSRIRFFLNWFHVFYMPMACLYSCIGFQSCLNRVLNFFGVFLSYYFVA